ncbi:MAG: hypothetical protein KGO96_12695 [Elusimicrobia bacterium]|nr:hypothetical protein [Elusimicrobiota bacterium]
MELTFGGATYDAEFDCERLNAQQRRVYELMRDGQFRTLSEISLATGDPQASVSARLRDLRKEPFRLTVVRRVRGERRSGLFEYRIEAKADTRAALIRSAGGNQ